MQSDLNHVKLLQLKMIKFFKNEIKNVRFNGSLTSRYPGNLNVTFMDTYQELLIHKLETLAISAGSACNVEAENSVSYVLKALGIEYDPKETHIRFGIGRFTTEEEIDYLLDLVKRSVEDVR